MRAVDEELQARLLTMANRDSAPQFVRIGMILMLVGVALGLAALVGIINPGNFFIFIYACFFGGLSVLLVGLIKRKKMNSKKSSDHSPEPPDKRRVSIRKNLKGK